MSSPYKKTVEEHAFSSLLGKSEMEEAAEYLVDKTRYYKGSLKDTVVTRQEMHNASANVGHGFLCLVEYGWLEKADESTDTWKASKDLVDRIQSRIPGV